MDSIDELATNLLEEAKRFLEKAKSSQVAAHSIPNLHAALMLAFCSLEAHVNSVADEMSLRTDLSPHDLSLLLEREVRLENGSFELTTRLKIFRLEDRLSYIHARFGTASEGPWRAKLGTASDLRNRLTHPKEVPNITVGAVERALEAVIETIHALYISVYARDFPAFRLGLSSTLDF